MRIVSVRSVVALVFVPDLGVRRDETLQQIEALLVVTDLNLDAVSSQERLRHIDGALFANDDFPDAKQDGSAGAHVARTQRRIERRSLVDGRRKTTGVLEAVHLRMMDRAVVLDAA